MGVVGEMAIFRQLTAIRGSARSPGVACIAARTPQQLGRPELSHFEYRSCRMTLSFVRAITMSEMAMFRQLENLS